MGGREGVREGGREGGKASLVDIDFRTHNGTVFHCLCQV